MMMNAVCHLSTIVLLIFVLLRFYALWQSCNLVANYYSEINVNQESGSLCLRGIIYYLSWIFVALFILTILCSSTWAANWPSWRGPSGESTTSERLFPTMWTKDKNIKWSVELPDRGNSSPIVWEDRVFISQAEDEGRFRSLMCFDRETGKKLWQSGVRYEAEESKHETNSYCASSPVTDGERIYVSYASAGFYCYDFSGRELWHRNFGPHHHQWGDGSSPILSGDLCFFFHGPGKGSFLVAIDKRTGDTRWKVAQPEFAA